MNRILCALAGALVLSTPAFAQNGSLTAIHGVPGLAGPVDVFANGNQLFSFDFGDQEGPLSLPAGPYNLDIQLNGTSILSGSANLAAGANVSVVAHLDGGGSPTLSIFANDISSLTLPSSRVIVRHTAAAPAVDVLVDQNGVNVGTLATLSNGQEQQADLPPGMYDVSLNAAGTTTTAFGPVPVNLENGFAYAIFAVGDLNGGTFTLITQRIDLSARVSVVHGIPGLPAPVDVLANGNQLFSFDFNENQGPLVLNAGSYNLDVALNGTVVLSSVANLNDGDDVSVYAHLDTSGGNVLSTFANDQSPIGDPNNVRVTVRHLANAPAVDIAVDSATNGANALTLTGVVNGNEASTEVPGGIYDITIFAAGTSNVVAGPVRWKPTVGGHDYFTAIGDLNGGSFTVNVDRRDLGAAATGMIVASNSGTGCQGTISSDRGSFPFGSSFRVQISGGPANSMSELILGNDDTSFAGVALPFEYLPSRAPGCFLNTEILVTHPVMLDANGDAEVGFFVPSQLAATWQTTYFQCFFRGSSVNPRGLTATDNLVLTLQ